MAQGIKGSGGTCSIDGCEQPVRTRGWCSTHVDRWYRHGSTDPLPTSRVGRNRSAGDPIERFWAKVDKNGATDCWLWTGRVDRHGYAQFWSFAPKRRFGAHRWIWESIHGPIRDGLFIDHLCHDPFACAGGAGCPHRRCVNPGHLALVTVSENVSSSRSNSPCAKNGRKSHCPAGHPYDEANTISKMRHGIAVGRLCRICRHEASSLRALKRKKAPAQAEA